MLNEARGGGFVPSCSAKFEVTLHMITVHIRSGAPKRGAGSWDDSGGVILVQQSECVISSAASLHEMLLHTYWYARCEIAYIDLEEAAGQESLRQLQLWVERLHSSSSVGMMLLFESGVFNTAECVTLARPEALDTRLKGWTLEPDSGCRRYDRQ